jgi:hypothetical protein
MRKTGFIFYQGAYAMINLNEEIEKFQPSLEIEQAEDVINNNDLTDITDILKELLKENKVNK